MKTSDFDYYLPERLIAQTPIEPRDRSRMLVYDRANDVVQDRIFRDLPEFLRPGDVLVINDTKVIPARIYGRRVGDEGDEGAHVEVLLLKRLDYTRWECIARPARKLLPGRKIKFSDDLSATVLSTGEEGMRVIEFEFDGIFEDILDRVGNMPLPPYIHEKLKDKSRYQTVYCREEGSAAAPTAGLHFTPELLKKIEDMGVVIARVLLHVGLGTFRPVKEETIEGHKMHSEYYEVTQQSADIINAAKREGRRVICVGTTSVRTVESASTDDGVLHPGRGNTEIFIYPGYKFKIVDCLITNFHLPQSTLIMLVSALVGREKTLELYRHAVEEEYRFFSFGDAMFIY